MLSRRVICATMCLRLTVNVHRDITQIFTLVSQERTYIAMIKRANNISLPTRSEINLTSNINSNSSKIIPTEILEIVKSRKWRREYNLFLSLSSSNPPPCYNPRRNPTSKIFHTHNELCSIICCGNASLRWPIYRLFTAAGTGGNPISLSTFPFSRSSDPDPTTRPSSIGEPNIQPTTNRPSNRPSNEPTAGVRSQQR